MNNKIEEFACQVCCQTYGISEDDVQAGFIDIATIIATITQIIEMIRDCKNRNQRIERMASRRLGRRVLINRIGTAHHRNCEANSEHHSHDDCDDIANQILDLWLAKSDDERDEMVPLLTSGE